MLKSRKIPAPASDRKDKRSRDESSPPTKTGDIVEEKNKPKLVEVATQVLRSVRTDKEVEIRQLDWDNRQDSVLLDDQREADVSTFYIGLARADGRDWLFRADGVTDDEWSAVLPLLKSARKAGRNTIFARPLVGANATAQKAGK